MKLKKYLPFLSLLLALPSCSLANFYNPLQSLDISDYRNAYYQGESYISQNKIKIYGRYANGYVREFALEEVNVHLTQEDTRDNPNEPFTKSGDYSLLVECSGIYSNSVSIQVNSNVVYVSSISVNLEKTELKTLENVNFTVAVEPSNYNVDLEIEFNNEDSISLFQLEKHSFSFYDSIAESNSLVAKAKSASTTYIASTTNFTVTPASEIKEIAQTYKKFRKYNAPSKGDVKFLVIPIWFNDSSNYISESHRENVREDLNKAYFGSNEETGWRSVSSFYKEESNNKLNISGTVSDWYELNTSISTYSNDDNQGSLTASLARNATNWYFSTHTSDPRSNYDSDHDGYLDGVIIIYGAPDRYSNGVGQSYLVNSPNLWAYCAWTNDSASTSTPAINPFFWASYDFMYGNNTAISRTNHVHYKGNTYYCNLDTHTYIHEAGHLFGLEDYYDYSRQYSSVGGFTMQDNNVGGHDPFSVMSLGWSNPYVPTESCKIKIKTFQSSKDLILLSPSFNSYNSVFDEYILLELYSPDGLNEFDTLHRYAPYAEGQYPQGFNGVGIRIWHVDARLISKSGSKWQENFFSDLDHPAGPIYTTAFTNTYSIAGQPKSAVDHLSNLVTENDRKYENYDLLHLIRKSNDVSYRVNRQFNGNDLFFLNESFSLETYSNQFPYKFVKQVEDNRLDNGLALGWSISINELTNEYAVIELTKI